MQGRRRIDESLAGLSFDRDGQGADMQDQLSAFIGGGIIQEHGGGKIGAQLISARLGQEAHEGGVGMGAVFHARLVTAQQRWRDFLRKRKLPKRPAALEGFDHDLGRFDIAGIALVGLQIDLGGIGGIGEPAFDKIQFPGKLDQSARFPPDSVSRVFPGT